MAAYPVFIKRLAVGFQALVPLCDVMLFAPTLERAYNLACAACQSCFLDLAERGEALPEADFSQETDLETVMFLFHFPPRHHAPNALYDHRFPQWTIDFFDAPHENWDLELTQLTEQHVGDPQIDIDW